MSYCRFGDDSDVYVFPTSDEFNNEAIVCCQCNLSGEWFRAHTPTEMIAHLDTHVQAGQKVPPSAFRRLRRESASAAHRGTPDE